MNLIIPMAGRGTRLRPQTSLTPKPLIEIAGKTIVQRIVEQVERNSSTIIKEIGFIIERPDLEIEKMLKIVATEIGIPYSVFFQHEPKGTAHAIYCAKKMLLGPCFIVFSDTLFDAELNFNNGSSDDAYIFVKEVSDPRSYGVVQTNTEGQIIDFIEKPTTPISKLAMVGMYYFKNGEVLAKEIKQIIQNKILEKGEYQLTTALENLKNKKLVFLPKKIRSWLDFGTPKNLLKSHSMILKNASYNYPEFKNTIIKKPCFIGDGVFIEDSIIGPNVSLGPNSIIKSSKIKNSIIQSNCEIIGGTFKNSIIGHFVKYKNNSQELNIGDYSTLK